ncbi:DUF1467 family protein [Lichenihabitans sp. Uapishka_5]|uniref:DUF1467 family protein n=1 Tax=Lichenihabitans sp. Uapishka_5 TaxID=3037302 RepID=UPI0029E8293A|nr:DUF1467 family protein [Lichenihabitans sp. Uapishka_5]MDX7951187.1 DUF1467 family protein [Lichenihabitans sp. Uapishka_5]
MRLPVPMPMALAIYFTMWWTLLFAVLPFGIRSQHEDVVAPGTEPGAPQRPRLLAKALWTTVLTTVVFGALMLGLTLYPDA